MPGWIARADVLITRIDLHWREGGRSPGAMWHSLKMNLGIELDNIFGTPFGSLQIQMIALKEFLESVLDCRLLPEPPLPPDGLGIPRCHFHRRPIQPSPNRVFVVMPFKPEGESRQMFQSLRLISETVHKSVECIRADDLVGHDVMTDVYEGIASAGMVIADTTGKNPNVILEIGIAITLGKPLFLLTRDPLDTIPFDMLRFRHCRYELDQDSLAATAVILSKAISESMNIPAKMLRQDEWLGVLAEDPQGVQWSSSAMSSIENVPLKFV